MSSFKTAATAAIAGCAATISATAASAVPYTMTTQGMELACYTSEFMTLFKDRIGGFIPLDKGNSH